MQPSYRVDRCKVRGAVWTMFKQHVLSRSVTDQPLDPTAWSAPPPPHTRTLSFFQLGSTASAACQDRHRSSPSSPSASSFSSLPPLPPPSSPRLPSRAHLIILSPLSRYRLSNTHADEMRSLGQLRPAVSDTDAPLLRELSVGAAQTSCIRAPPIETRVHNAACTEHFSV